MAFELKKYKFEVGTHKEKSVIWVHFPNDATLRNELKKQFPSVQFSWTKRCWYLNDIKIIRERIGMQSKTGFEKIDTEQVAKINHPALQRITKHYC
jgi:hypothetical protein